MGEGSEQQQELSTSGCFDAPPIPPTLLGSKSLHTSSLVALSIPYLLLPPPANKPFVLAFVNTESRQGRTQQQVHPAHTTTPAQEPTVPGAQRDRGGMKLSKDSTHHGCSCSHPLAAGCQCGTYNEISGNDMVTS